MNMFWMIEVLAATLIVVAVLPVTEDADDRVAVNADGFGLFSRFSSAW